MARDVNSFRSFTYELLELGEDHALGCKCCRFNKGVDLPIPRELGIGDTADAARELSICIFKDWIKLNAIVKRFEGTIQKRWMKKGIKQRRDLLLKAWPDMSPTHRPDFENFRNMSKQAPRSRTCHSAAFLWPYINLEDLLQRHLLLLFLNSRARNIPDTFRTADVKAAHLGQGWAPDLDFSELNMNGHCCNEHYFEDHDCSDHCMLFQSKHSPATYGRVIDRSAMRLKSSQLKYLSRSPEGLLAMEIQSGIYSFLLSCAKLILHDIEESSMFYLAPHQPEPKMPSPNNSEQWSSLAAHALESPYRIPQQLNLDRLQMLAGARRASAEDHVWMLREDPAYFMDTLREWNEHNGSYDGKVCHCKECYNREAGRLVTNAFVVFVFWDDIYRKLTAMDPIAVQLNRAREKKVRLSTKDEDRWTALIDIIEAMKRVPLTLLMDGLPTSPRLRGKYECTRERWDLKPRSGEAAQRVDRLFDAIFRSDQRQLHGLQGLVQEVQYMLDTDAEAASYIDSWIATQFSDLALLSELVTSIDALAPWFDQNKAFALVERATVDQQIDRTRRTTGLLSVGIRDACTKSWWDPTEKSSMDYPADKRPTKANIDQMRAAEQHLDMFWWTLEIELQERDRIKLERVLESRLFHPRELYRTPAWKEPAQLPTPSATPKKPLTEMNPNAGRVYESPSKSFEVTPAKEKVKTRGTAAALDPRAHEYVNGEAVIIPEAPPEPEKIKISKKAYRVFCALLPGTNSVVQQRGEIAWDELVYAMDAIGLEPEKLYGSVWIFKPVPNGDPRRKIDLERSIQFHEPKECRRGQKVPRPMVRTFGRRLRHAFGWEDAEAMFESE